MAVTITVVVTAEPKPVPKAPPAAEPQRREHIQRVGVDYVTFWL